MKTRALCHGKLGLGTPRYRNKAHVRYVASFQAIRPDHLSHLPPRALGRKASDAAGLSALATASAELINTEKAMTATIPGDGRASAARTAPAIMF
jgi:hypothetical protein